MHEHIHAQTNIQQTDKLPIANLVHRRTQILYSTHQPHHYLIWGRAALLSASSPHGRETVLDGLWWWLGTLVCIELCIVLGIVPLRVLRVPSRVNYFPDSDGQGQCQGQQAQMLMWGLGSATDLAVKRIWKRRGFGGDEVHKASRILRARTHTHTQMHTHTLTHTRAHTHYSIY